MNANYGLFPPLAGRVARTREEAEARRTRARRLRPLGDRRKAWCDAGAAPTAVAAHEALPSKAPTSAGRGGRSWSVRERGGSLAASA